MTSRKSFFSFKIMAQSVKQSKYIMILHTIALFLMTTATAYMTLQKMDTAVSASSYKDELSMWLSGFNPLMCFAVTVISIITVIYLFSYLFKSNSVQFFNSMPYTRECMYVSRFAGCAVSVVIPVLLVFAANSAVYAAMDLGRYFPYTDMLTGLGTELLCYFAMLCLCVFAASLSGNFFAVLIVTGFIGLYYPVTTAALSVSFDAWYNSLSILFSYELAYIFPPALLYYKAADMDPTAGGYIFSAVYALVFLALGLWAYVKRRSENTNRFFAYKGVGIFLKYYVSLVASLFFGALFLALSDDNIIVGYIGYILILFVVYAMLQAIFEKDMRSMFSNMKQFAIFAVIWALVLIPLTEGVLEDVGLRRGNLKAISTDIRENEIVLRDSGNIDAAFELLENADKEYPEEAYKHMWFITNPDNPVFKIERMRFVTSYEQLYDYEKQISNSEEYKNMLLEALEGEYNQVWIELATRSYSVRLESEDKAAAAEYDGYHVKEAEFNKLKGMLKDEIVKYDYEECLNSGCFASVHITLHRGREYNSVFVPIYLCYTDAVRFMKEEMNIKTADADSPILKASVIKQNGYSEAGDCIFMTEDAGEAETLIECSASGRSIFSPLYIELDYGNGKERIYVEYNRLSEKARDLINPEGRDYENLPKANENPNVTMFESE